MTGQSLQISLQEALSLKKKLEADIKVLCSNASNLGRHNAQQFIVVATVNEATQEPSGNSSGYTLDHITSILQSNYDSTISLIERYNNICTAISVANATNSITIGNETMSIAHALGIRKAYKNELTVLAAMKTAIYSISSDIDRANANTITEVNKQKYVKDSAAENMELEKPLSIDELREKFVTLNKVTLYDPMKASDKIDARITFLEEFENKIDFKLTEYNCRTMIEIMV